MLSPTNKLPDPDPTMNNEHQVQIGLINALCNAAEKGRPEAEIGDILDQIIDFSKAHFMSEELLMRLDSYDEFHQHAEEHQRMIASLDTMRERQKSGQSRLLPELAREALSFLLKHIETQDRRYVSLR